MARSNNKHKVGRVRNEYKGPFPPNKNLEFDSVRKNMKPQTDGPTADMRSYNDSTISQSAKENQFRGGRRPKSLKKKAEIWWTKHWLECFIGVVVTALTSGVGIVVFNHGNQIVSINKDIEYMKKYNDESKNNIYKIKEDIIENKTDIKLIQQKLESIKEPPNKPRK